MNLEFSPEILKYCESLSEQPEEAINQLERQTYLSTVSPQMISGRLQGRFLSFISKLLKPKYVFEIGTFTGYSALCFAEGLQEGGEVHTCDPSRDYDFIINQYASKSQNFGRIKFHKQSALQVLDEVHLSWDLFFVDGSKKEYPNYINAIEKVIKPGAVILVDNVLWYGKVTHEPRDKETQILHEINERLFLSNQYHQLILPLRDGIHLAIKK